MTLETTFPDHPRMSNPTLVGVAFEMQFDGEALVQDVSVTLGQRLDSEFPRASRRTSAGKVEVTVEQPVNGEPTYTINPLALADDEAHFRFYSHETSCSLFIGPRVFVMTEESSYESWSKFSSILKSAIRTHHEAAGVRTYSRLKLVYSNRIPWSEGAATKVFRPWILPSKPEIPGALEIVGSQQVLTIQFPDGAQEITISMPGYDEEDVNNEHPTIQFDIDHYAEFIDPQVANIKDLEIWLEIAHERIYQTYISTLTSEFVEARK